MKHLFVILICILLIYSAVIYVWAGCNPELVASIPVSGGKSTSQATGDQNHSGNLSGNWKQFNNSDKESYMTAVIHDEIIEVYWVTEADDASSLYWWGSFVAPENENPTYSWESQNDRSHTDGALMASPDNTKEFTFEDGELRFQSSILGTSKTVRMEKVEKTTK